MEFLKILKKNVALGLRVWKDNSFINVERYIRKMYA